MYPLAEAPELTGPGPHTIEVVVDRLTVKASGRQRLTDSVETALKLAGGQMTAAFIDLPAGDPGRMRRYFDHLACPNGHPLTIDELGPRSFSFNSPLGACPVCAGLGTRWETDPGLAVPDGKPVAGGRGGRALGRAGRTVSTSCGCCAARPTRAASAWTPRGTSCRPRRSARC